MKEVLNHRMPHTKTKKDSSKTTQELKNKRVLQGCLGCLGLFVLLGLGSSFSDKSGEKNTAKPAPVDIPQTQEQMTEPRNLKESVRDVAIDVLGEKTNMGKESIESLSIWDAREVLETAPEGSKSIWVDFNASENLTTKLTKRGMYSDAAELFQKIFALSSEVYDVAISIYLPMVDVYGNEQNTKVMVIALQRPTAEKVNWEGFDIDNLTVIAGQYWEHPAFSD